MRSLPLVLVTLATAAPALAQTPPQPKRGTELGERAMAATFYGPTTAATASMVVQMVGDVLPSVGLPSPQPPAIQRGIDEIWSDKRLLSLAAGALERQLTAAEIQAALDVLDPKLQAMMREGAVSADPVKAQEWLWVAIKRGDAAKREPYLKRIAQHFPPASTFRPVVVVVVDFLANVALMVTGNDDQRGEIEQTYTGSLESGIRAMDDPAQRLRTAIIGYRNHSLEDLQALAKALESPAVTKLQRAAADAWVEGVRLAAQDSIARLHLDMGLHGKK